MGAKKEEQTKSKQEKEPKDKGTKVDLKHIFKYSDDLPGKMKKFGLPKLICILAAGILILLFISDYVDFLSPSEDSGTSSTGTSTQNVENISETDEYLTNLENRLKQVLMKVEDIGQVEVMITVKSSKESVVLKDENSQEETTKEEDSAGGSRENSSKSRQDETVFQESETGVSSPYIVKELEPEIEGILVIAQGGANETVKSDIVQAVQVLFDVPAHKIKVMKMNN